MSSGTNRPVRSAAWRISLWGTLAFACGTLVVFLYLQHYVAADIQRRTDAWLSGEVETLGEVAARTPKGALYGRVVRETAEMASHEIPGRERGKTQGVPHGLTQNGDVFFLQTAADGSPLLWVGSGDGGPYLQAIRTSGLGGNVPIHIKVTASNAPFRVAEAVIPDGSHVYLGVSERDELHVLHRLERRFLLLWLLNVLLGFGIIFWITRGMLGSVRKINAAAAGIGEEDLSQRVPVSSANDEVAELAGTLNRMLERIERSVYQLRTITNSLAHDLRSPLTAVRARLEMALTGNIREREAASIECAINELDRLTEMLSQSLDVAEAQAHALRMERSAVDLVELAGAMVELYQPSMSDKGLAMEFIAQMPVAVWADASLLHRIVANLLDNELKHVPALHHVTVLVGVSEDGGVLTVEDDGPGFEPGLTERVFERGVKSAKSEGRGLGLAFVRAVVEAHGGSVVAENRAGGGALLRVVLPLAPQQVSEPEPLAAVTMA